MLHICYILLKGNITKYLSNTRTGKIYKNYKVKQKILQKCVSFYADDIVVYFTTASVFLVKSDYFMIIYMLQKQIHSFHVICSIADESEFREGGVVSPPFHASHLLHTFAGIWLVCVGWSC